MFKSWLIRLILVLSGVSIGVLFTAIHYELNLIEKDLKSADRNTNVLEYYAKDGIGNEFCFEAFSSLSGLHEINAIINAKPILDWFRPNLRDAARRAKTRMQKVVSQFPEKFECEHSFVLNLSILKELGYDTQVQK